MKLNNHANTLKTNATSEGTNFGIGDASVVIDILRNRLYENKIQTLVQEYICNARDAMREAGKTEHAFDITIPNYGNPVFKVKDYGPGISPDRMTNIFINYGSSTKRGCNGQTGGFGIGAKSAWAYTDSFTIVSVVDGVRRGYIAHTGSNNNGRLELLSESPTNEANGCEIQVAVRQSDIGEFKNSVFRAIYYWNDRPNLKGDNLYSRTKGHTVGNIEIVDGLLDFIDNSYSLNECVAIIDGIPYMINGKLFEKCHQVKNLARLCKEKVLFHFGNGEVEVSASRESIADSDISVDALNDMATLAIADVISEITTKFSTCTTPIEWFSAHKEMSKKYKCDNYNTYKDYKLYYDNEIHIQYDINNELSYTIVSCLTNKYRRQNRDYSSKILHITDQDKIYKEKISYLKVKDIDKIYYQSVDESASVTNKRIKELFKTHNTFILVSCKNNVTMNRLITDLGLKDLSQVTYVNQPRKVREKVLVANEEIVIHCVSGWPKIKALSLTKNAAEGTKWLYYPIRSEQYDTQQLNFLSEYIGIKICGLSDKAIKQIQGDKYFQSVDSWLDNFKASNEEINNYNSKIATNYWAMELLTGKITNDQHLNKMIIKYKDISNNFNEIPLLLENKMSFDLRVVDFSANDQDLTKLIDSKYPLMRFVQKKYTSDKRDDTTINELIHYINSK